VAALVPAIQPREFEIAVQSPRDNGIRTGQCPQGKFVLALDWRDRYGGGDDEAQDAAHNRMDTIPHHWFRVRAAAVFLMLFRVYIGFDDTRSASVTLLDENGAGGGPDTAPVLLTLIAVVLPRRWVRIAVAVLLGARLFHLRRIQHFAGVGGVLLRTSGRSQFRQPHRSNKERQKQNTVAEESVT
jgi:hypothetical protein